MNNKLEIAKDLLEDNKLKMQIMQALIEALEMYIKDCEWKKANKK